MRVVAIRLKMEIIQFVKLYHPSDGSSFTSVSTYLQNNSSGRPSFNPRGVRMTFSHGIHHTPLFSQTGCFDPMLDGCNIMAMATIWPGPFREK